MYQMIVRFTATGVSLIYIWAQFILNTQEYGMSSEKVLSSPYKTMQGPVWKHLIFTIQIVDGSSEQVVKLINSPDGLKFSITLV